jgi:hypothetical protein
MTAKELDFIDTFGRDEVQRCFLDKPGSDPNLVIAKPPVSRLTDALAKAETTRGLVCSTGKSL